MIHCLSQPPDFFPAFSYNLQLQGLQSSHTSMQRHPLPISSPVLEAHPIRSLFTEGSRPSQDISIPQASSLSVREDFKALLGSGFRSFSGKTKEDSNCSLWGMMQSNWLHFVKENELSPGYSINKSLKTICKSYWLHILLGGILKDFRETFTEELYLPGDKALTETLKDYQ